MRGNMCGNMRVLKMEQNQAETELMSPYLKEKLIR